MRNQDGQLLPAVAVAVGAFVRPCCCCSLSRGAGAVHAACRGVRPRPACPCQCHHPPPLVTSVRRMGRERRRAFDVWILCTHPPTRSSVHVFTYYHLPTHVLSLSHPHTAISLIRSRVFSTIHYPLSATHHPPPTLCIERRASCPSTYRL